MASSKAGQTEASVASESADRFSIVHEHGVFSLPIRVYNQDIDAGRVVFVANYLKFMERARSEWLHTIGVNQRHMERELRAGFVVKDVQLQCHKPAYLDDIVQATVQIEELGRSAITLRQQIYRNSDLLCDGRFVAVCVSLTQFRPVSIAEDIRTRFSAEMKVLLNGGQRSGPPPLAAVG